jgi:hypothetical protein
MYGYPWMPSPNSTVSELRDMIKFLEELSTAKEEKEKKKNEEKKKPPNGKRMSDIIAIMCIGVLTAPFTGPLVIWSWSTGMHTMVNQLNNMIK